jgi:dTDP-4-amino-4,6-dideoxygalactose transaminase
MYKYPLFTLNYTTDEESAVIETLRSNWISTGPRVNEFEQQFASEINSKYALAVTNCTVALHMSFLLYNIGPGDEVLCPSLTFVATINAIRYVGATPIFCDIHNTHNPVIDPYDLKRKITKKTKAICVMHYAGFNPLISEIKKIADEFGLILIEDACHGPLSLQNEKNLGTYGDVSCFSFFSNKNISLGEGGMICFDDSEKFEMAKLLRSHGMTALSYEKSKGHTTNYDVVTLGYNYRMDDIRASIGLVQLSKFKQQLPIRRKIRELYISALKSKGSVEIPFEDCLEQSSNYIFPVLLPEGFTEEKKEHVRFELSLCGIQTTVHYPPAHKFLLYREFSTQTLLVTEEYFARSLTLPFYVGLEQNDIEFIIDKLYESIRKINK